VNKRAKLEICRQKQQQKQQQQQPQQQQQQQHKIETNNSHSTCNLHERVHDLCVDCVPSEDDVDSRRVSDLQRDQRVH
jgi:hypothetical protein